MESKAKRTSPRRILEVLEAICVDPNNGTAAQLAELLEIPLPTIYRLIETLTEEGFVAPGPANRIIPGVRLRSMILNCLQYEPQVTERRAILRRLSEQLDATVSLSVPLGTKLVYFDRVESNWPFQIALKIGDPLPLHCCASGKLYLSSLEHDAAIRVFKNIKPKKNARNTITGSRQFATELEKIRQASYALDDEEWYDDMVGASVPVKNGNDAPCAFLSTHSLTTRKSIDEIEHNVPFMQTAAQDLEGLFFSGFKIG